MNKNQIAKELSTSLKLSVRQTKFFTDAFFNCISDALVQGNRVEIRGFGSLKIKAYQGYQGRNPKTGESILVKPKKAPFFKIAKGLKEAVNRPK